MDTHGVPWLGDLTIVPAAEAGVMVGSQAVLEPEIELRPERSIEDLLAELDALVGLDHVKEEVR